MAVVTDGPIVVAGKRFYVVLTASQEEAMYPEADLERWATDLASPVSWLASRPLVDSARLARALTQLKLTSSLTDLIYSFSSARTLFRVHQFKPVLKLIQSPVHRLLLADEVGLGKTIEAGLIWTELDARSPVRRTLIVTPPGLTRKWQLEMERRFDREVRLLTANDLLAFAELYAERGDRAVLAGVTSYPQLRNDRLVAALSSRPPTFDLAIFDEAHALRNPNTKTHHAAELIVENSDAVLFLSATPINLGSQDLFNLLRLLRPDEFTSAEVFASQVAPNEHVNAAVRVLTREFPPDKRAVLACLKKVEATRQRNFYLNNPLYERVVSTLESPEVLDRREVVELQQQLAQLNTLAGVYTRTRKRDLPDQQIVRRPVEYDIEFTPEEQALYDATVALVAELRRNVSGVAPALAAIMPARQASSCLPVMWDYVHELAEKGRIQLDLAEGEEDEDEDLDEVNGPVEVLVRSSARDRVADVINRWERLGSQDSKFDKLVEAIERLSEGRRPRVLLFSFFRLTLAYLERRLNELGYRCAQMHGGTPIRDRNLLLDRFRAGELDILLCSEVGSEGLDFEFCNVLVNYDLPWNPMRLEQRIGRLDRFGQASPVIHIVNFKINGTIDTEIFLRLYDRIGIFENSIGELEPILGQTARELTRRLASPELTVEEQRRIADDLANAVLREQSAVEAFEEQRQRLVGADDYVQDNLSEAKSARRYVTPDEMTRYVGGFLQDEAHPARLEEVDTPGASHALFGGPLLADHLRTWGRPFATLDFGELVSTLEAGGPISVTFDAAQAYGSQAVLLGHRHPLVRAITEYYRQTDRPLHPGGYVQMQSPIDAHVGRWIVFAYILSATGLVPRRELKAVAFRPEDGAVSDEVGEEVLTFLAGPEPATLRERDIPLLAEAEVVAAYESVLSHIVRQRDALQQDLTESNAALIAARQQSLRQELESRRARLLEMATRPDLDERIQRMRFAQVRNLEDSIAAKLQELEGSRHVSVGFKVVLGGLVDVSRM